MISQQKTTRAEMRMETPTSWIWAVVWSTPPRPEFDVPSLIFPLGTETLESLLKLVSDSAKESCPQAHLSFAYNSDGRVQVYLDGTHAATLRIVPLPLPFKDGTFAANLAKSVPSGQGWRVFVGREAVVVTAADTQEELDLIKRNGAEAAPDPSKN